MFRLLLKLYIKISESPLSVQNFLPLFYSKIFRNIGKVIDCSSMFTGEAVGSLRSKFLQDPISLHCTESYILNLKQSCLFLCEKTNHVGL